MYPKLIKEILCEKPTGQSVEVAGWVKSVRDSKAVVFIATGDGSCFDSIQLTYDRVAAAGGLDDTVAKLTTGTSIKAAGKLVESKGAGQSVEILLDTLEILGSCNAEEYPLQKKRMTMEYLRGYQHLRARTNTFGAVVRVRNSLSYAVHTFFRERGFCYVHTPIITCSDCEGAGQMFQVTTLPIDSADKLKGEIDYSRDFFARKAGLTVSGQLEAETLATAVSRVYTFGPTFRAENSNTPRHLSEFWMIEPEMAFFDLQDMMSLAEDFVRYLLKWVLKNDMRDLQFFDLRISKGIIERLNAVANSDFKRVTYDDAIEILTKNNANFEFPVKWGDDIATEHERYLTEEVFKCPVMCYNYPREIKSFYMKANEDGRTVRACDVLVPGIGEIIGGSEREADYNKLLAECNRRNMDMKNYEWYLDLRRFGSVPHSGFGLGFERLIRYVTGMENIRDVIPFPRAPKLADC